MNGGETFLLLLGPALALAAGLAIYAIAARANGRAVATRIPDRR